MWCMFEQSSNSNINVFTEAVVGFIGKLVDDTVPKTIILSQPNAVGGQICSVMSWNPALLPTALGSPQGTWRTTRLRFTASTGQWGWPSVATVRAWSRRFSSQTPGVCGRGWGNYPRCSPRHPRWPTSLAVSLVVFETSSAPSGVLPGGEEAVPAVMLWAWCENDVQECKHQEAAGPDGVTGWVLGDRAVHLAPVSAAVFNLSLSQRNIPNCFRQSAIVSVAMIAQPTSLNDS